MEVCDGLRLREKFQRRQDFFNITCGFLAHVAPVPRLGWCGACGAREGCSEPQNDTLLTRVALVCFAFAEFDQFVVEHAHGARLGHCQKQAGFCYDLQMDADSQPRIFKRALRFAEIKAPLCAYGWICSVQRNSHMAVALMATDTAKSALSGRLIFDGPLPASRRNIQGRRIMA